MMNRITVLIPLVNMLGAVAIYFYFSFILPAYELGVDIPAYFSPLFTAIGTVLLCLLGVLFFRPSAKIMFDVAYDRIKIKSLEESEIYRLQREALRFPMLVTTYAFLVWILAGFIFGFLEPMITAGIFNSRTPDLVLCMQRFLGISLLGGGITSMILYFILENEWRSYIPNFFPGGHLNRVKHVFKLNVRKRFLIVFLGIILIPLPIIGMTIYASVREMHMADAITRSQIIASLVWELGFITVDSLAIVLILAYFLSKSILVPLLDIKKAIKEVENNNLDTRVEILSNDELGDVAEGFNLMIQSLKESRKVQDSFGKYVCKEIRDEIIAGSSSLDGEMKRVTLLFSDLRNFTGLVEKNHPKHVVKIMNQYFNEMTLAVKEHKGLVIQYVGDEIEAVFGAPVGFDDHPEMAVKAALAMRERLSRLNKKLEQHGFEPLAHGIGIHSGAVLAGNIGSMERMSYALVGDTVNSASRIEGLTKEYGCDIILSQTTYNLLTGSYNTQKLASVNVKGKEDELIIYKLLS
ncbi:MAG: HAMP domain-containing protein [Proteobacteria bacterium]|nr:HAMP domain-containing protein [Pseudomonadota bacterium]MBU1585074.1 HAMP domain-containing protein [Pseudomonadota bacterium]MBU2455373.1 HAMP domain-containing protein [Pseudomonadota bacterium]MBU2629853.1 HAMP domain-containing protein [Pseudomonadota bacterium]